MLLNRGKLKDKMILKGKNNKDVSRHLAISEQSFCAKMRYRQEFKEHEIESLVAWFGRDILF